MFKILKARIHDSWMAFRMKIKGYPEIYRNPAYVFFKDGTFYHRCEFMEVCSQYDIDWIENSQRIRLEGLEIIKEKKSILPIPKNE